jgi:hypothetical protein
MSETNKAKKNTYLEILMITKMSIIIKQKKIKIKPTRKWILRSGE